MTVADTWAVWAGAAVIIALIICITVYKVYK